MLQSTNARSSSLWAAVKQEFTIASLQRFQDSSDYMTTARLRNRTWASLVALVRKGQRLRLMLAVAGIVMETCLDDHAISEGPPPQECLIVVCSSSITLLLCKHNMIAI